MLASVLAVYNWDSTIFDEMYLPEGVDRQSLINMITVQLAELNLVWNRPEFLKWYIGEWSKSRKAIWDRLYQLATVDYNPLDNYDRKEQQVTTHGHVVTNTHNDAGRKDGGYNDKKYVYGFNSSDRVPSDDIDSTNGEMYSDSGGFTNTNSGRDVVDIHAVGNIGTMTYQKMITDEFELRKKLNFYQYLVEEFKHEFCVMVW